MGRVAGISANLQDVQDVHRGVPSFLTSLLCPGVFFSICLLLECTYVPTTRPPNSGNPPLLAEMSPLALPFSYIVPLG